MEKEKTGDTIRKSDSFINKLIILVGVIGFALIFWKFITGGQTSDQTQEQTTTVSVGEAGNIKESDPIAGKVDSKVVLIEYGDFQCPACGAFLPVVNQLKKEFGDRVAFVHRDFPLRSAHKHAQISAQAAYAAKLQGKFWEMHDKLYETQASWSTARDPRSDFEKYARDLNLDVEKFKTDMNSSEAKSFVDESYNESIRIGLNYTPSFILNGELIDTPRGFEPFKILLEQKLNEITPEATESAEVAQ